MNDFVTVLSSFRNEHDRPLQIWLEMLCEGVILPPGESLTLLARPKDRDGSGELLPLSMTWDKDGSLIIYAHTVMDPDWHILYKGKLIKPEWPTKLADLEVSAPP
ncbi:MAG: hypothetical protein RL095_1960 [Verrucomicrobiota bacterium]|jgi:hypothetical protein